MIPERCKDPSRLFVALDVSWLACVAFGIVCGKPTDDPSVKAVEMRPILCGWLAKLYGGKRPGYIVACLDSVGPTWRHAETAHLPTERRYKAGRTKRPQEFYDELAGFIEILRMHGIPCYRAEGWEADDVAAALTARALAAGLDVVLVTLDHDWRALARDRDATAGEVYCWSYGRADAKTIGPAEMLAAKDFGLSPAMVPQMTAICGDGDNIRGAEGIGPGKARIALERWGSVDGILAAPAADLAPLEASVDLLEKARNKAVKALGKPAPDGVDLLAQSVAAIHALDAARLLAGAEKIRATIAAHADAVRLGLTLATLDPYAPLSPPFVLPACVARIADPAQLAAVYRRNQFHVLADDVEVAA